MSNQVIPQVGQSWLNGRLIDTIKQIKDGHVYWEDSSFTLTDRLHDFYTFSPANSLEWLAVNLCKWNDSFKAVKRAAKQDVEWCNKAVYTSEYTKQQWQECRNKLFGEVKMNNQVIPQVGQIWVNVDEDKARIIDSLRAEWIETGFAFKFKSVTIQKYFKFVPANDLEWLAVNMDMLEWEDKSLIMNVSRRGDKYVFGDYKHMLNSYSEKQIIECSNRLFGEVKMETQTVKYWDGVSDIEVGDVYLDDDGQACKLYAKPAFNDSTMFIGHAYEMPSNYGMPCVSVAMKSVCSNLIEKFDSSPDLETLNILMNIPKPEEKPVYTQAMKDAGERAANGCIVLVRGRSEARVVAFDDVNDSYIVVKGASTLMWCSDIKPIKTEEEKLIDEVVFMIRVAPVFTEDNDKALAEKIVNYITRREG